LAKEIGVRILILVWNSFAIDLDGIFELDMEVD